MNASAIIPDTGEVVEIDDVTLRQLLASRLALDLPETTTIEEWAAMGRALAKLDKGVQWWIGDWWIFGGHAYGERAAVVAQGIFNRSFGGCRNAGVVARAFKASRRRDALPWSHHAEVAGLEPDIADTILDDAETNDWSSRDVRAVASQMKAADRLPEYDSANTCTVADLHALIAEGRRFGSVYADPPWLYDNQGTRAATRNHYGGMTVDEMCALPIEKLVADDAHLHLWTTNGFLFECPRIFDAWGFEFRSSFVWAKPQIGIGNYWRNSHELLLTAIRGNAKRFNNKSLRSWLECDRGEHSAKPEQVRSYIEKASPKPYLELFGRRPASNWTVWGNQIERSMFDQNVREVA
jgi:N6-adenosine-specific RNA methylase IME4